MDSLEDVTLIQQDPTVPATCGTSLILQPQMRKRKSGGHGIINGADHGIINGFPTHNRFAFIRTYYQ